MLAHSITRDYTAPRDTITLDETGRHRRRIALTSDGGLTFTLDLPEARLLRHGDGLVLDNGDVIEVRAAPEALMDVRGADPEHLLKLAWQIGNRHLAAEITRESIRLREDPVIAEMLKGLGAAVTYITAPFDPEGGAYGDAHTHHHSHD
ncbi:MAG: urease accessory protein UreE [Pseudomonadota bacterium]